MGRIVREIEIEGQPVLALFDSGATHTYIEKNLVKGLPVLPVLKPYRVGLGGKVIEVKEVCTIRGRIEGLEFDTKAIPVAEIGAADGKRLGLIIGALTMEEWEIRLDPKNGALDLAGLRRREFTEYPVIASRLDNSEFSPVPDLRVRFLVVIPSLSRNPSVRPSLSEQGAERRRNKNLANRSVPTRHNGGTEPKGDGTILSRCGR